MIKKNLLKNSMIFLFLVGILTSCNDYLDREPLSDVTPEDFFENEGDLGSYIVSRYNFPTHAGFSAGTFISDNGTDNQAAPGGNDRWVPGELRVGTNGGAWDFGQIRQINYFLNTVEQKQSEGEISGSETNINHYIGEGYFLRAYEYFGKLKALGDFPIVTEILPDEKDSLVIASERRPRNEVARFIIEDLNKAIELLKPNPVEGKNRISREVALLLKSRVGLFEGTWETYHKGTAFVPGNSDWPGAEADYLSGFSINIDEEIDYFLTEAMEAAEEVADMVSLTPNVHPSDFKSKEIFSNPYFIMFGANDMSSYDEVLLWRQYNSDYVEHRTQDYLGEGGAATGYTRSLVESYLMKNGLPIYASGSGYDGDQTLDKVRQNRDERLQLFLRIPGDDLEEDPEDNIHIAGLPNLLDIPERKSTTGYEVKKGLGGDSDYYVSSRASVTGSLVFRASEAYLNYIEAVYVRDGSLDGTAIGYWKELRNRAGVSDDIEKTISATDLSQEDDWAKYSKGQLIDRTLFNIRRERRNEFIAEGMRYDDLRRWRALDHLSNYQIEGFNLWDEIYKEYVDSKGNSRLKSSDDSSDPNVSPKSKSNYIRPYQIQTSNNKFYEGYNWTEAHYLEPIAYRHFLLTSDGDPENSVIYQNPYWSIQSGSTPISD